MVTFTTYQLKLKNCNSWTYKKALKQVERHNKEWVDTIVLDPESIGSVDQDPDPGRLTLFPIKKGKKKKMHVEELFFSWRLLREPKRPLKGFRKIYRYLYDGF